MDINTFIKSLRESFSWLFTLGYDLRQVETSVYFEKHSDDESHAINFFWAEYDVIKIQGVFALKRFDLIESIIEQKTGNLDYTIHKKWEGNIPKEFDSEANGVSTSGAFYLSNENQIRLFSEIVKEFYSREVQPFFNSFKSVASILDWLNQNDIQEHSKLLVVNNNSMMLRKLIIMKEGHSEDFEDLFQRYGGFLKEKYAKKESPYSEMYEVFLKLVDYFNQPA